eukprot:TRINITY_DN6435_c0_g1_i2.p2 TRINITY_DN6435_c0_g1~~TRINITY_DN6435_c0_g1_i2.p2  ORF type:complete len:228 (-),score=-4.89 TRINITY_DN6435_c0_g1_i2:144-827(-)
MLLMLLITTCQRILMITYIGLVGRVEREKRDLQRDCLVRKIADLRVLWWRRQQKPTKTCLLGYRLLLLRLLHTVPKISETTTNSVVEILDATWVEIIKVEISAVINLHTTAPPITNDKIALHHTNNPMAGSLVVTVLTHTIAHGVDSVILLQQFIPLKLFYYYFIFLLIFFSFFGGFIFVLRVRFSIGYFLFFFCDSCGQKSLVNELDYLIRYCYFQYQNHYYHYYY